MTIKEKKIFVILCVTLFLVGWLISQTRLTQCVSGSLKGVNYLFVLKSKNINRGDIVFIRGHKNPIINGNLAKKVVGLPGDIIHISKNTIFVSEHKIGPLQAETKTGKLLTPLQQKSIPEGYVFVAGDDERSFDSRYEEFGLVPLQEIWGRAVLSW
jgi:signal peptidase I